MKLLSKHEIAKAQSDERMREILEGKKLSAKVDDLRMLRAEEEKMLEKFRDSSLEFIHQDINSLTVERDKVKQELSKLEEKLKSQLSKTKQRQLEELEKKLKIKEEELLERSAAVDLKEIDIALTLKENRDIQMRVRTHEDESARLHKKASEEQERAQKVLENALSVEMRIEQKKKETEASLSLRENSLNLRTKELEENEEKNNKIRRELDAEKIRLGDQRKTLERALERLRKNRLA